MKELSLLSLTSKRIIKIVTFLTLVIFIGCQKNNVNDGINEQDEILIKLETAIASIQFNQLKSGTLEYISNNDKYSSYAKELYDILGESIINNQNIANGKLNSGYYKGLLRIIPKPACYKNQTTDFEISFYKISTKSLKNKNTVEALKIISVIESFISINICDNNQQEKFLYFIAALKKGYLNKLEHSLLIDSKISLKSANIYALSGAAWDRCWDNCMNDTYDNYNLVDWIQFAICPPEDVAWNAASCGWDCAWE